MLTIGIFPYLILQVMQASIFIFLSLVVWQSRAAHSPCKLQGRVVDVRGKSIAGANILIMNTAEGTVSDQKGNFEISTTYDSVTLYIALDGKASMKRTVPDVCHADMLVIVMKEFRRQR